MEIQTPTNISNNSSSSTPFVTAPSSPGRSFFSVPSSPIHFILSSLPSPSPSFAPSPDFEFSSRFPSSPSVDAHDLFHNGQIRPIIPINNLDENTKLQCKSVRRRARSHSPERIQEPRTEPSEPTTASRSSSTSSTSSIGRSSKKWVFFKELILRRSKSEGSTASRTKEKLWHFAKQPKRTVESSEQQKRKPTASVSAHERHYKENRAQAEEMRRRTALPYRQQGILSWMGFGNTTFTTVYSA